jgi:hypothetical protein
VKATNPAAIDTHPAAIEMHPPATATNPAANPGLLGNIQIILRIFHVYLKVNLNIVSMSV